MSGTKTERKINLDDPNLLHRDYQDLLDGENDEYDKDFIVEQTDDSEGDTDETDTSNSQEHKKPVQVAVYVDPGSMSKLKSQPLANSIMVEVIKRTKTTDILFLGDDARCISMHYNLPMIAGDVSKLLERANYLVYVNCVEPEQLFDAWKKANKKMEHALDVWLAS